jgi:hypothetical protein
MAAIGARQGDFQSRMIADPTVAADPVSFFDELQAQGPLIKTRVSYLAVDHGSPMSCCDPTTSGS